MSEAASPPSAFEAMLVDVLKGQWPTLPPENREAKAATLAKIILAGMKRQNLTVINAEDVVNIRGDFKDADLEQDGVGAALIEAFAKSAVRRILTTDLVMQKSLGDGVALSINIIAPGWALAQQQAGPRTPSLARMRVGGSA